MIQLLFQILFLLYILSIIVFISGNLEKNNQFSHSKDTSVSVITAVRNGEKVLPDLLAILSRQIYNGPIEFIIADDESSDRTKEIIREFSMKDSRFKYVSSRDSTASGLRHKKRALDSGIAASTGEILLFTDVDCRMSKYWVKSMASCFTDSVDYVVGFTRTVPRKSLVSVFQAVDLHMLMACTRATTHLGMPLASSGQNQAFRRTIFQKIGGYSLLKNFLQGDDSLFLQIAINLTDLKVVFASDPDSFVTGRTENSWRRFLSQRIRWAGDTILMWKFNRPFFFYLAIVFLTNTLFLISFSGIFSTGGLITAWVVKFIFEYALFISVRSTFRTGLRFSSFLFWFIINIPYIVAMGVMSSFSSRFPWHGRNLHA